MAYKKTKLEKLSGIDTVKQVLIKPRRKRGKKSSKKSS